MVLRHLQLQEYLEHVKILNHIRANLKTDIKKEL